MSNSFYIAGDDAVSIRVGDEIRLMELYNIKIAEIKFSELRGSDGSNNRTGTDSGGGVPINASNTSNSGKLIIAEQTGDEIHQDMPKIQWVAMADALPYKVLIARELYIEEKYNTNSLETCEGFAESFVSSLNKGTMVQLVRFGFCRLNGDITAIFTHR